MKVCPNYSLTKSLFIPINGKIVYIFRKKGPGDRHRQINYTENVVSAFTIDEFKTFFRVSRVSVQKLRDHLLKFVAQKTFLEYFVVIPQVVVYRYL
jgi:hypothetical protein